MRLHKDRDKLYDAVLKTFMDDCYPQAAFGTTEVPVAYLRLIPAMFDLASDRAYADGDNHACHYLHRLADYFEELLPQ